MDSSDQEEATELPFLHATGVTGHLGVLYLQACALQHGFGWCCPEADQDLDSIDLEVRGRKAISDESEFDSYALAFQVKCTTAELSATPAGKLKYKLKRKNWNDLLGRSTHPRLLLVVVGLEDDRLQWSAQGFTLNAKAFWASLKGLSKIPEDGQGSKTLYLNPAASVFSPQRLFDFMKLACENKDLPGGSCSAE